MVDGRTLPTANVDSSELLTLNWVVSKWDASCIIGTQYGARERLRYAMQTTTGNAKRRVQCGYTGWKKTGDRWIYLLPGHPSCEVMLRGKLRSYFREYGATDSDYAVLTGLLQIPIVLAICCGLRRSEALGLSWSNIDFENDKIFIGQKVKYPWSSSTKCFISANARRHGC